VAKRGGSGWERGDLGEENPRSSSVRKREETEGACQKVPELIRGRLKIQQRRK